MLITTSIIEKKILSDLSSYKLDPVTMILEDIGPGKGKLFIDCYGKAWTAYWGGMGSHTIAQFINTSDVDYLANKLTNVPNRITDYEEISRKIGHDVDRDTLAYFHEQIEENYGPDWCMDLPQTTHPDYTYLCRIVTAVKDAVSIELKEAA